MINTKLLMMQGDFVNVVVQPKDACDKKKCLRYIIQKPGGDVHYCQDLICY